MPKGLTSCDATRLTHSGLLPLVPVHNHLQIISRALAQSLSLMKGQVAYIAQHPWTCRHLACIIQLVAYATSCSSHKGTRHL